MATDDRATDLLRVAGEALHAEMRCAADEDPCPYCRRSVTMVLANVGVWLGEALRAKARDAAGQSDDQYTQGYVVASANASAEVERWCGVPPGIRPVDAAHRD